MPFSILSPAARLGGLFLALLALTSVAAWAQQPDRQARMQQMAVGTVGGTVLDADTSEPVASATVALWRVRDSTLVTGAITNVDGTFTLDNLMPGRYYAKVSFVGYRTNTVDDIALGRDGMRAVLGEIQLAPDTAQLDEVQVTAERDLVEIQIDRTVYNTKDQPALAGGSANDVLQNIPSVEVDIDGNVSLRGNQNVAILLNGRPVQMTGDMLSGFLASLSADMIERVEVIPNPSAKYDPDGMGGILNIVLKQDAELGWNGGVSLSASTTSDYNVGGNLGVGKGPLNLRANYGFRYDTRDTDGTRFQENRYRAPLSYVDQDNFGERLGQSHVVGADLDYKLSNQNSLTASAMVSRRLGESDSRNVYDELDATEDLSRRYERLSIDDGDSWRQDYALGFRRVIDPSTHELTAELRWEMDADTDFERYRQDEFDLATGTAEANPILETSEEDEQEQEGTLQVDYVRPLAGGKLEAGYKGELRSLDSEFYAETFDYAADAYRPERSLNNTFTFDEQVHAVYGIYGTELGRFDLQGGLRLEQAFTTFDLATTNEAFDNNYFSVFPSAFVTYELVPGKQLKASYSKRIDRPRTRALNPFSSIDDPLFRREGNPYLKPEYTHSFEVSYAQFSRGTSLTVTPYYRRTIDVIRRLQTLNPETGVSTLTFDNFASNESYGAELVGTYRVQGLLQAFGSFNAYRLVTDGSNIDTDLSSGSYAWTTRLNVTLESPWAAGPTLQLSYFYRSPIDIEQGRIGSFSMANVALQQKLLNDQATFSLRASDVFGTMGFQLWRDDAQFYQESTRNWDAQALTLSFTYTFGQQDRNRRGRDRGEGMDFDPEDMD